MSGYGEAEAVVVSHGHGLPYSKGLMAQSLSASGIVPERAYELARMIEQRLARGPERAIDVQDLCALAEEVIGQEEDARAVRRFRDWRRLDHLDRPLMVMLGGTAGVGKSTLATMLANRLGLTQVVPTDVVRQVLRSCLSHAIMPAVHYSSFEAGRAVALRPDDTDADLVGFVRQAESVATGLDAIVERAVTESVGMVVEGVHVVPGLMNRGVRQRCLAVEALVVVDREDVHRAHFSMRGGERPADRYLGRFRQIRKLQRYLVERAEAAGVPVIDNSSIDGALTELMELVLDAVQAVGADERPSETVGGGLAST